MSARIHLASHLSLLACLVLVLSTSLFTSVVAGESRLDLYSPFTLKTEDDSLYIPFISKSCPIASVPDSDNWLQWVNYYRAAACLPPVTENAAWSAGNYKHAIYIVKNDELQHSEDPNNQWYTPEGLSAAQRSNLAANHNVNASDRWAVDTWMQAPFHALGIIDPQLTVVGYGSYREADGGFEMGAGLDVLSGGGQTPQTEFPVIWPGSGTTVPILLHWGEYPSPLTSCPGYSGQTGLPVILQIGSGELTPAVSATSFTQGAQPLEHCVFDETNYSNPDAAQQSLGRSILNAHDAIVLIPRIPLSAGTPYTVSISVNGQTYTWSFSVSESPQASEVQSGAAFVR
jgi:hypothetical protein